MIEFSHPHATYVAGQLWLTSTTFLFNVAVAHLLGPQQIGVWQTAVLVGTYGMMLMLGTLNGMGREVPFYSGRLDQEGVSESVTTTVVVLAIISGIVTFSVIILGVTGSAPFWLILGLILLVGRLLNNFSMMLLRSLRDYVRLGLHQGGTGLVLLASIAWLWAKPSLVHLLAAMFIALVSVGVLAHPYLRLSRFSWSRFRQLVVIGMPIMLAGVLFGLLTTVDRFLILTFLGTEALGLYTPAIMALGVLAIAPSLVSNIMYPKLAHEFGRGADIKALLPVVKQMLFLNVTATLSIAVVFLFAFYFLIIPRFLTAYLDGRMSMVIMLGCAFFLPVAQSIGDLFNVIGLQKRYLSNMIVGLLGSALVGLILVASLGLGLEGVAIGTLVGTALFAAFQVVAFMRLHRGPPPRASLLQGRRAIAKGLKTAAPEGSAVEVGGSGDCSTR